MFLFILESLGTSELILIGILALVLLGPRKLPEIAKKAGKMMAEFRGTAAEFKETWQREVNFEEESKALREINFDEEGQALRIDDSDNEPRPASTTDPLPEIQSPSISEADPAKFKGLLPETGPTDQKIPADKDKKSWL